MYAAGGTSILVLSGRRVKSGFKVIIFCVKYYFFYKFWLKCAFEVTISLNFLFKVMIFAYFGFKVMILFDFPF